MADYISGSDEETGAYIDWLVERTKNILSNPVDRAAVEALAHSLLLHEEIGYKKVRATIKASDEAWEEAEGIMLWKEPTKT